MGVEETQVLCNSLMDKISYFYKDYHFYSGNANSDGRKGDEWVSVR